MKKNEFSKAIIWPLLLIFPLFFVVNSCKNAKTFDVVNLQVEYQKNPIGIDELHPRFSWEMRSEVNGKSQLAYQIFVYKDKDCRVMVWNSGKINSDQSLGIRYEGDSLNASVRYYWRVCVWDNKHEKQESSPFAFFETSLLGSGWHGAQWIQRTRFNDSQKELNYSLDMDAKLLKDNFGVVFSAKDASNMYMWAINTHDFAQVTLRRHYFSNANPVYSDVQLGKYFSKSDLLNKQFHLRIEVKEKTIKTYINKTLVDIYDDQYAQLIDGLVGFRAYNGNNIDERANLENVILTKYSALGVESVDTIRVNQSTQVQLASTNGESIVLQDTKEGIPQFRKRFIINKKIKSAKIYTSALGVYDLFINGNRVGRGNLDGTTSFDELKPGSTDFHKRVQYSTYDVSSMLLSGENVIGAEVSSGWWAGAIAHGEYRANNLAFISLLKLVYADGSTENVISDKTWETAASGPIKDASIYDGEVYDARLETDWNRSSSEDFAWTPVTINSEFKGQLVAYVGPSVQVRPGLTRDPKRIVIYDGIRKAGTTYDSIHVVSDLDSAQAIYLKKGQTVIYDLGQNLAGWVRFKVKGNRSTQLTLRFAEMLNDNGAIERANDGPGGSILRANLRGAKARILYTMNGSPEGEIFKPSHTFFGFRYCEVTATEAVQIQSLRAEVVGSNTEEMAHFQTSNTLINQLYSNVMWGQRSNFLSVPSDCPQRDERLGWMGDAQVFCRTASYNANVASFFQKWMRDVRDSQRDDGAYASVSPFAWVGYGQAAWAEAGVIVPWTMYLMYGNKDILSENYESMEKYLDFLSYQTDDLYQYNGAGLDYGDWLAYDPTESRYIAVCYYAYASQLMSKIAKVLSVSPGDYYSKRSYKYDQLYKAIKAEFASRYLNEDGTLKQDTQTAYLLALKLGLFKTDDQIVYAVSHLDNKIVSNGYKLSTGFLGTGILNQTLSQFGLSNTAYRLLLQRENPSWLYSVDQGATTIWERWDSYTKEDGFNKDGMNSFNHYSYGAVAEWMFRYMAGIDLDENSPAFKRIILQPTPNTQLKGLSESELIDSVNASFHSYYGEIKSSWKQSPDGRISYQVSVPANTTACLFLPIISLDDEVLENNEPLEQSNGITVIGVDSLKMKLVCNLLSGNYSFQVKSTK